jgi:hypothetical protein
MINLPTHKRPKSLLRFIEAYHLTQATEPVLLLIDEDDNSYDELSFPSNFSILRIPPGCSAPQRANIPFEKSPHEPYYAIMGDDVVPLTPLWDQKLKEHAQKWKVAYGADGIQNEKLTTHPFIGGEFVRAQGFVAEPAMGDWYGDNCLMDVARTFDLLDYVPEVKYDHQHYITGKSELDATYAKQSDPNKDFEAYKNWGENGGYTNTLLRIAKYAIHNDNDSSCKS